MHGALTCHCNLHPPDVRYRNGSSSFQVCLALPTLSYLNYLIIRPVVGNSPVGIKRYPLTMASSVTRSVAQSHRPTRFWTLRTFVDRRRLGSTSYLRRRNSPWPLLCTVISPAFNWRSACILPICTDVRGQVSADYRYGRNKQALVSGHCYSRY